jgi:excisionase family DNA binding protein
MRSSQEQLVYTIGQAAEVLQCSQRHLQRLIKARRIPFVRLGARVLIPAERLRQFLNEQSEAVSSASAENGR